MAPRTREEKSKEKTDQQGMFNALKDVTQSEDNVPTRGSEEPPQVEAVPAETEGFPQSQNKPPSPVSAATEKQTTANPPRNE